MCTRAGWVYTYTSTFFPLLKFNLSKNWKKRWPAIMTSLADSCIHVFAHLHAMVGACLWYMNTNECKYQSLTSAKLRDKVAFNPFLFGSFFSSGIKQALKAPGNDWKRDLSIPNVRIWNTQKGKKTKKEKRKKERKKVKELCLHCTQNFSYQKAMTCNSYWVKAHNQKATNCNSYWVETTSDGYKNRLPRFI